MALFQPAHGVLFTLKQNVNAHAAVTGHPASRSYVDQVLGFPYRRFQERYCQDRGELAGLPNTRPDRVRDSLAAAEALLFAHRPLFLQWIPGQRAFKLLLADGALLQFSFSASADLISVTTDVSLQRSTVGFNAVASEHLQLSVLDRQILALAHKKLEPMASVKKAADVKSWLIPIHGHTPRLSMNSRHDLVLCWHAKALMLYAVDLQSEGLRLLSTIPPEGKIVHAEFSRSHPQLLYSVEVVEQDDMSSRLTISTYEYMGGECMRTASAEVVVPGHPSAVGRSTREDQICIGCSNGALVVYNDETGKVRCFTPTARSSGVAHIRWHYSDAVLLVCADDGSLRVVDSALFPVALAMDGAAPSAVVNMVEFLSYNASISIVEWMPGDVRDPKSGAGSEYCVVVFDRGPVLVIKVDFGVHFGGVLSVRSILAQRIACSELDCALELASNIGSVNDRVLCLLAVSTAAAKETDEAADFVARSCLERLLVLLPDVDAERATAIEDHIRAQFSRRLACYDLEQAFILAEALDACDMFEDIVLWAEKVNDTSVAMIARRRAEELRGAPELSLAITEDMAKESRRIRGLASRDPASLSTTEAATLGLWMEAHGQLESAHALYKQHRLKSEGRRLKGVVQAMTATNTAEIQGELTRHISLAGAANDVQ